MADGSNEPLISIVIPTKDRPQLLARALASALAQVGVGFEIVVVDDGDGSGLAMVADMGLAHVRALSSSGQGQVLARRLGVANARGAFIAFLDDDDWWADVAHLARLQAAMPAGPALTYASGIIVVEDAEGQAVSEMPFDASTTRESLASDNTLIVSGILYDRRLHHHLGDFDPTMPYYWDWDWYLRIVRAGFPLIGSTGDAVRVSARVGSVSSDANLAARRADLDHLADKHGLGVIPLRNHESIARDRLGDTPEP